ncbi:MAG: T9SS type A sorting domain-containing protein, partial [Thermoflexibacter sp.]|nr:T9SS type A sorting domain-containing protein [Thermoflexibacter sp.]
TRGAAGSVYAVRTVNIPDLLAMGGSAAVVRFDVVGSTNNTSVTSAARILVGTGFTDDNSVASGTIASQLNVNFEGSSNISFTSQPANTKVVNNFTSNTGARRKRITWVINTSSNTLNYTPPNGGATENVPANRIDIWDGNTRVANDLNVVTNGAIINNLKIVLYDAQGSFTLENIKINPIAELLTGNYTQTMLTGNPDPTKPLCFSIGTDYNVTLGGGTNAPYSTNSPASFVYNPNNEFVFHLSAPDGTFTNFTIIGRTASTTLSSSFPLVIPKTILPTMATGSNFRIRVVSTDPPMVAQMSTNPLSILSFSIVKASDNSAPVLQAITTTAPNQFTDNFKINTGSYAGAATYQWKVRYKSSGMIHNIPAAAGGTASTFQGNGTLSTFAGHFPYGTGEYELFCEVTTNPTSGSPSGCGVVNTPIVRVIVECDGCPKNSMASSCSKNIVFNGSFTNGSNASPVYPASLPDPNDPNSEGVIPFDGAGTVYGAPSPNIVFFNENRTQTYGSVTLKFNTPYGYSTEYGGTTSSNFQSNMGNEVSAATEGNGTSMFPENTWAVGTNPRHYHSNFCDADGNVPVPQGNVGLGGGAATWTTTAMGLPATDPRTGPPFTNLPFTVTSYNGGGSPSLATPTVYANGSPFTANKVWSQRFKVRKNTDYVFSFWAVNLNDINAIYGVFANCTQIGNGIRATGVADRCVWKQYTFLWNSGEVGTVEFSVRNVSTVRSGNDLSVDDVMFYRCDGNTNNFPTSNKFVWRGYNTDWFNADNWGNCAIPDCTSDVIVPINASNIYPIIQASALTNSPDTYASGHPALTDATRNTPAPSLARVRSISIDYGANITITPGWNLDVCGDFTNKKNEAFPPSLNQGIIGQDGSTITFTALETTTYTAKVTGNLTNQTGANNSLPNVVIRKKSNTQIVELQDDLDIAGDLVIVDGTFDANQKNISFNGEKFINGTTNYTNTYYDGTNNPALATNSAFVNMGEGGASFDHGSGVVEFRNLRSTGDQIYSREPVVMTCSSCLENFYDVKMNQESENRDLDIQRGNFNVENTLELSTGHLFTSVTNGQKEVYVSNSSTTSILNYSEQSYVVTTIDAGGGNANNLRLRREVDNTGVYEFPIGGDASGGKDPTGAFNGYRLVTMTLNQPLAGVNSVRSYFSTNNPGGAPNLPGTVADACSNNNLSYDICGGGHWDLVPLDGAGSTVAVVSPNYNLEMLSIPSAFTCAGANITFMKRTNGGDPWGFGGSCYVSANRRDNFTSFSKIVPVGTNEILPVEFLSFDAVRNKSAVDVKWETISERGASHFIVQRSADGKNFVNIGRIQAIGNANTTQKYLFTDMTPMQGMNYYRLQQVDIDNTEILTNVVAIMFEGDGGDLIIYPNPSEENAVFNVIIPTQIGADVELKMTDALGREVYMQRVKFSGVAIQVPANFAKGLYTLSVATPTESYVRKLIIK